MALDGRVLSWAGPPGVDAAAVFTDLDGGQTHWFLHETRGGDEGQKYEEIMQMERKDSVTGRSNLLMMDRSRA
ncbi:hypothetical protein D3C87_1669460 [compost metagenome]